MFGSRPPSRNRSLHASSSARSAARRGAAQREELAPRLLAVNLLLCSGRFPSETCQPAGLRLAPFPGHRPALAPPRALEHPKEPPGADALPALLPRAGLGQQGSRDLQREDRTVVVAGRRNRRERDPRVPRLRHLPGAPCACGPGTRPARPVPGPTYSQLLAAAENTAKTRSRRDRRHERGLMVPCAPSPGQRPQGSRRGGRWAPRGRAGAPGRGARRGSASEQPAAPPAAAPAARRTRLSAPPQSRDAAVAAEAGGRPAGRAGGGPRMGLPGRVQRRGTTPPPHGGGPEPAGLGFSWGASPARRPDALGASAPLLQARLAARRPVGPS